MLFGGGFEGKVSGKSSLSRFLSRTGTNGGGVRITGSVLLLAEEAGSLGLSVMQQSRSMTRVGYFVSCLFILQGVVSVVRAIAFPESFSQYSSQVLPQGGGFRSFILAFDTGPIVFLLLVVLVLCMIDTQPRDEWTAWGASFGSAAMVSLFDWFSIMEGIFRIIVFMSLVTTVRLKIE